MCDPTGRKSVNVAGQCGGNANDRDESMIKTTATVAVAALLFAEVAPAVNLDWATIPATAVSGIALLWLLMRVLPQKDRDHMETIRSITSAHDTSWARMAASHEECSVRMEAAIKEGNDRLIGALLETRKQ